MNKQEVIEEIKKLEGLTILDKTINFDSKMISKEKVLNIVKQLDEPENPKEKLYTVEIPNPNASGYGKTYLAKNKDGKVELYSWSSYTSIDFADNWKQEENAQLTESEIKQDFEWAWPFAKEVEE